MRSYLPTQANARFYNLARAPCCGDRNSVVARCRDGICHWCSRHVEPSCQASCCQSLFDTSACGMLFATYDFTGLFSLGASPSGGTAFTLAIDHFRASGVASFLLEHCCELQSRPLALLSGFNRRQWLLKERTPTSATTFIEAKSI